ncbi:hypothetical protein GALMADRAFT_137234 [Galerina marginata CBS 339.88]|uniref:DUF6535 domain-containing protein n=1 Tax=Galerina marginata (strain CBS 339.88) TaxID=685588 RepID=A0A067TAL1_GALM3|nr:hypothetical protein GALMADRAFT_137234 [Galerina marginata CBS 339.88]
MSVDLERRPARLDSQATKVEAEAEEEFHRPSLDRGSAEKLPRFSFNQASLPDNPYNPAPRRQSRNPNLKGPSPIPNSQPEFQEQFGDRPWHCGDPHRYGAPKKGDAWQKCNELTEKYDNEMCDAWKEEVDKLLIFAGLFSATITSFTIESYKWLSEDPNDVSVRLLGVLASQATNSSVPSNLLLQPFTVSASDVRINAAWFLSLTLGLTTVLIGILCLQWLREYQRDAALPHKEAVALRQMRYEGLLYWRVPDILSLLPILLQSSLILFFIGLLDLLWARHTLVAGCVTAAVGVVMLFLAATTALPALQHAFTKDKHLRVKQCPYKSPQSWLFYRSGHTLFWIFNSFELPWSKFDSPRFHRLLKSAGDLNWMTFDMRWRQFRDADEVTRGTARKQKDSDDLVHGLQWINTTFSQSVEAVYPIYHGLADLEVSTAATTISGFYLGGQIDDATLRVMLDDRFSPAEEQKRDILSAYYLRLHQDAHPVLKNSYIEAIIRILNSQEVPQPFYDWLSEILQELASTSPSSSNASASLSLLNPEINVQLLLCVKMLMPRKYGLQTHDIVVAWALLHRLLSPTLMASQEDRGVGAGVNVDHLKLACGMFEEFEQWITRGKEISRWDRVKLCAEGMLTLFPPSVDPAWLESICPDMSKALSLLRALEVHVATLGGPAAVLLREKWWLNYWEVFTEKDWDQLLENFQVLVEEE